MTDSKNLPTLEQDEGRSRGSDGSHLRIPPEKIAEMRAEVRRRLEAKRRKRRLVTPYPPPRYDDVFFEGLRELSAEGEPVE